MSRLERQALLRETRLMSEVRRLHRVRAFETRWLAGYTLSRVRPMRITWKTGTSLGFRDVRAVDMTDRYTVGAGASRTDGALTEEV